MRQQLLTATASVAASIDGSTQSIDAKAETLTIVVISDLDCSLLVYFVDDAGAETLMATVASGAGTNAFIYPGNFGRWRPSLSRVGASAWTAQVYGTVS